MKSKAWIERSCLENEIDQKIVYERDRSVSTNDGHTFGLLRSGILEARGVLAACPGLDTREDRVMRHAWPNHRNNIAIR